MEAFHSFWSLPSYYRNQEQVTKPDHEILTTILSVLEWKKHNGNIKMITDSRGLNYFKQINLEWLWDEIDTSLDCIEETVDPFLFWAAGKLYALQTMESPCVMLDTDLIIWKNLNFVFNGKYDVVTAHSEALTPFVYPNPQSFHYTGDYCLPENWDFSIEASNTAFLYIRNSEFKNEYVKHAMSFFYNVRTDNLNPITAMCFAEQRILPMLAKEKKQSLGYLIDRNHLDEQEIVTHTWGYKSVLDQNQEEMLRFCKRCIRRIKEEFPETSDMLYHVVPLQKYI